MERILKVAAFTGGRNVPSARFRVRQHIAGLAAAGIEMEEFAGRFGSYPPESKIVRPAWGAATLLERVPGVAASRRADVTLLQREMLATACTLERFTGRPRILDVDDAIWLQPRGESAARLARLADLVICGNSFLAERFAEWNRNVVVVPTAVDTRRYRPAGRGPGQVRRIGWIGASSGLPYLYRIEPALAEVLRQCPGAVVRVVSDRAPRFQTLPAERVEFVRWSEEAELGELPAFSVGLMPLDDSDWSRGKCSYKMLLYMACGVPVVCSPVGMNREVLALGACGIGAGEQAEWVSGIGTLLERPELAGEGRRIVERHYSLDVVTPRLAAAIRGVAAVVGPRTGRTTRVLHMTTSLDTGGAERMLVRLVSQTGPEFEHFVVPLTGRGVLAPELDARGIAVESIDLKRRGRSLMRELPALGSAIHRFRPDVVQGWMFHGSFAAELLRFLRLTHVPVLWNIRHSLHDLSVEIASTNRLIRGLVRLSRRPFRILYNSTRAARQFEELGYDATRSCVIPNGFDCGRFQPDAESRAAVRAELGVGDDEVLIGLIARYHPVKDHETFLRAAAMLPGNVRFLLAGKGTDQIAVNGLASRVIRLGERADVPRLTAALDIATCCSRAEAFPNSIGEAMACAVPCVVTDVGDAPELVDGTGRVIPTQSPEALAAAWRELLAMPGERRRALGEAARARVQERYSLSRAVSRYEAVFLEAAERGAR